MAVLRALLPVPPGALIARGSARGARASLRNVRLLGTAATPAEQAALISSRWSRSTHSASSRATCSVRALPRFRFVFTS